MRVSKKEYEVLLEVMRHSVIVEGLLAESLDELKRKNILLRELIRDIKTIENHI